MALVWRRIDNDSIVSTDGCDLLLSLSLSLWMYDADDGFYPVPSIGQSCNTQRTVSCSIMSSRGNNYKFQNGLFFADRMHC